MAYKTDLKWQSQFSNYSADEKKVLLALSHDKYQWRTEDRIVKVTGLEAGGAEQVLSDLVSRNIVRVSLSRTKNIIYGLRERIG